MQFWRDTVSRPKETYLIRDCASTCTAFFGIPTAVWAVWASMDGELQKAGRRAPNPQALWSGEEAESGAVVVGWGGVGGGGGGGRLVIVGRNDDISQLGGSHSAVVVAGSQELHQAVVEAIVVAEHDRDRILAACAPAHKSSLMLPGHIVG